MQCAVLCFRTRIAHQNGFSRRPNATQFHSVPTPKGGGVGIVLAFGVTAMASGLPIFLWLSAIVLAALSF